jgi:type IV fimbrial biogenesis protein FimT
MARFLQARQRGHSLLELGMALVLATLLLSLALPSLRATFASVRMDTAKAAIFGALQFARASAVARADNVVLCPSRDGRHCSGGLAWQEGFIVFADHDLDEAPGKDGDILRVGGAQEGIAILATAGRQRLTYRSDGSSAGSNVSLTLCDARGSAFARSIVVSNVGRVRMGAPTAAQAAAACAQLRH